MGSQIRRLTLAAVAATAVVGLTGCSGGGTTSGAGSASSAVETTTSAGAASAPRATVLGRAAVRTRAVIMTGEISLTSRHLGRVRSRVDGLLSTLGGTIDHEDTTTDRHGRVTRSVLSLRVPASAFRTARLDLEAMGTLVSSTQNSDDVTTKVIDTAQRVRSLRTSLGRLHAFQRRAGDVGALLRYEQAITSRTAELQSMQEQAAYLADQTAMSTITLDLSRPGTSAPPPGALSHAGFLPGLRAGWHALAAFGVVVLTAVGAALPFLVPLAVLGWPAVVALRVLRRRRRTTRGTPPREPAAG